MRGAAALLLALTLPAGLSALWQRASRETNSHAAAARGAAQYQAKEYGQAARAFADADRLAPDARSAFNLGTAQIASGDYAAGASTLDRALRAAALRPDALYNRGNSELAAKAYEHAIRDYTETLKLRPADGAAKRNLEIALRKLSEMQRAAAGGANQQPQSSSQQQNQQQSPSAGQQRQQQPQNGEAEALLRSVQQQEDEELQRMKRARAATARVGW